VDDAVLLGRARRGDETAFTTLYERYQAPIFRYAAHMCGREAGDDIVQETFLAVLRKGGTFDAAKGTVGAYLFGIARHFVFKQLATSHEGAIEDVDGAAELASDATILDDLTNAELMAAVREAVQALPPTFREAIVLCELEEIDYATAADIVGCPIGTIRSRLHRAKGLLATKLATLKPLGKR